jgi:xyloglucan-specific endo-beta-1,4-glucanase
LIKSRSPRKDFCLTCSIYIHSFFKMQIISLLTASVLAATALAAPSAIESPSKTLNKRATTICGQWDSVVTGTYTLYQDLWGESAATSGSQCSTFTSLTGSTMVWSTSWTWAGGSSSVKSYANVVVTQATGVEVSTISTIPSVFDYR